MPKNLFFNASILKILLFIIVVFCIQCNNDAQSDNKEIGNDSINQINTANKNIIDTVKFGNSFPLVKYKLDTIKDRKHLARILNEYGKRQGNEKKYRAFSTINRKELRFLTVGSAILIPDTILNDLRAYSVFPQYYPAAADIPKIILVSNRFQSYACYENGKLVRFAAANTGKERTPSYPGRYALAWKVRNHRSSLDSSWVMPFTWNFHLQAGSALHQFEMPGKPASHSCVRQFIEDAEWLFYWGKGIQKDSNGKTIPMSGTPLIIIDHYDFHEGKGKLWLRLTSNRDSILNLPDKPMEVEEALIPISQIPQEARGSLRDIKRFIHAEDTLRARGVIREGVKLIVSVNFNKLKREKAARLEKQKKEKEQKELLQNKDNNNKPVKN